MKPSKRLGNVYLCIYYYDGTRLERWYYNKYTDLWSNLIRSSNEVWRCTGDIDNFNWNKFKRKLKKWNLPSGLTIDISGCGGFIQYQVKTKNNNTKTQ
jgi:hypothetical protein